jgi:7-keto-8-aminopelargonate synthetase-like enzyme
LHSLVSYARAKMAEIADADLTRVLRPTLRGDGLIVERGGKKLIYFSCNDYLGLSRHPKVIAAAIAATETYGAVRARRASSPATIRSTARLRRGSRGSRAQTARSCSARAISPISASSRRCSARAISSSATN